MDHVCYHFTIEGYARPMGYRCVQVHDRVHSCRWRLRPSKTWNGRLTGGGSHLAKMNLEDLKNTSGERQQYWLIAIHAAQEASSVGGNTKGLLVLVIRGYCCLVDYHQQSMCALKKAKHRVSKYYQAHDVTNTFQGPGRRGRDVRRCVRSRTRTGGDGARCTGNEA